MHVSGVSVTGDSEFPKAGIGLSENGECRFTAGECVLYVQVIKLDSTVACTPASQQKGHGFESTI